MFVRKPGKKEIFLTIVFIFIFFVLFRWKNYPAPLDRDEGEYAYAAWIMGKGIIPYENSFLQKPPMIIYTYMLGQIFDQSGILGTRVLFVLSILATTFFLGLIIRKIGGGKGFFLIAFIFNSIISVSVFNPTSANTEYFMLLPLVLILYFYLNREKLKTGSYFWVGVFFSVAFLFKQLCLFPLLFLFIIWFKGMLKSILEIKLVIKRFFLLIVGFVLTFLIVCIPFIIKGSFGYLWESAFKYNFNYVGALGSGFYNLLGFTLIFTQYFWPIYPFLLYYLWKKPKEYGVMMGLFIISFLTVYQGTFGHYYLPSMLYLSIITAESVILFSQEKFILNMLGRYSYTLFSFYILILLFVQPFSFHLFRPYEINWTSFGVKPLMKEAKSLGTYINSITGKNDYVYVLGTDQEINYYAKRLNPSRFVISTPLTIETPMKLLYQNEVIRDVEIKQPKIIVDSWQVKNIYNETSEQKEFLDYFSKLLSDKYRLVGGYVLNSGIWEWRELSVVPAEEDSMYLVFVRNGV